jgi:hypothetical protein
MERMESRERKEKERTNDSTESNDSNFRIKGDTVTFGKMTPEEEKEEELYKKAKKAYKLWAGINTALLILLIIIVVYAWYSGYYCKYTIDFTFNPITNMTEGMINYTHIPIIYP